MRAYINTKYIFVYFWLASIIIYVARPLIGYGSTPTVISQLYVDIIGIFSLYSLLARLPKCRLRRATFSIFVLLAIMLLYYVIYPKHVRGGAWLEDGGSALNQIKLILFSFSGFTASAYFTLKKKLDQNILRVFFVCFLIVSIIVFFYQEKFLYELYGSSIIVNNSAYLIISLLPLSFIFDKKIRIVYIVVAILISAMSAKRGVALQSIIISFLVFFLSIKNENNKGKIKWLLLAIVASFVVFQYYSDSFDAILNRLDRDGTDSSSRENIWNAIFKSFIDGNPIFMIFGYGSLSTVRFAGNYAHNDFIEILSNFGFVGLYFLLSFYYMLYKKYCLVRKNFSLIANILLVSVLMCLFKSLFSMNLYAVEGCVVLLSAGFAMAYQDTNKKLS